MRGSTIPLDVRGEEKKLPLAVNPPVSWIQEHMNGEVTVVVMDGQVVEIT